LSTVFVVTDHHDPSLDFSDTHATQHD